ncbi:WYL domain-containing protein [Eggerthellaceae bacterium zg-887]|uniref:helix-turn-helix transcriptional regulator n=1 Tax=Xiamenia xianingshaonis TaxID=2682776 RepID=UPI0013EE212B|nr:WYL domain-containing protein [Xiamenia xianingshaonis]NGM18187.1 WYL domain-containing protein [Eggerthellaceae bacterium zg-893]NHM16641.1 WYL domain-containing protein [Xiamenia xianingshaonis]
MSGNPQKLKLLYLMKLFGEETDEVHGVTMNRILEYLSERGISAERKSVYRDIHTLREFGFDVRVFHRLPDEYALANRLFTLSEIMLMIDAVQGSQFLTKKTSDHLVKTLKTFASKHDRKGLDKAVHVHRRVKSQNDSALSNVDVIQQALTQKRKVRFRYFSYDGNKQKALRHEGRWYEETPVQVVFSEGRYYLVAYNEKHESFVHYRVDRMIDVEASEAPRVRNEAVASYNVRELEDRAFGMYAGEAVPVTFSVDESLMDVVVDRFGKDVVTAKLPDGRASVHTTVLRSPVFYGWLAQLGDKVTIEIPQWLAEDYQQHLRDILAMYEQKPAERPSLPGVELSE